MLTASGLTETAWENAEEIREGMQVPVLPLLDSVVLGVAEATRRIRREQQPSPRGTFDGEFRRLVMEPGALYRSVFPLLFACSL